MYVLQIRLIILGQTASSLDNRAAFLLHMGQSFFKEPIKYRVLAPNNNSCCWQKQKNSAHMDLIILNAEVKKLFPTCEVTHITYPVCY